MKKVIEKNIYDTETAVIVCTYKDTGLVIDLYRTSKGNYFMHSNEVFAFNELLTENGQLLSFKKDDIQSISADLVLEFVRNYIEYDSDEWLIETFPDLLDKA